MSRRIIKNERRTQILDALIVCMKHKSFHETTIRDIAKEADLPSGMIHYYFNSKDEILLYYLDRVIELKLNKMDVWLKAARIDSLAPREAFLEVFDFVKRTITTDQRLARNFIGLWEISLHNPAVRKRLKKAYDIWADNLVTILGKVSTNRTWIDWASSAIIAFMEGVSVLSLVYGKKSPRVQELLDNFQKRHLFTFSHGE